MGSERQDVKSGRLAACPLPSPSSVLYSRGEHSSTQHATQPISCDSSSLTKQHFNCAPLRRPTVQVNHSRAPTVSGLSAVGRLDMTADAFT